MGCIDILRRILRRYIFGRELLSNLWEDVEYKLRELLSKLRADVIYKLRELLSKLRADVVYELRLRLRLQHGRAIVPAAR